MTPSESRLGTDADGIYIFLPQDLATAEKDKTWDMLKITCSQPFNKLQKYGLSHVVARSALPVKEEIPSSPSHCSADLPSKSPLQYGFPFYTFEVLLISLYGIFFQFVV